jgi:NADPH2:quinone reductase
VGQRVWVHGAQSYRPFGTVAQYAVVADQRAVRLPDHLGASPGIPGITAHRAVFADGPVDGRQRQRHRHRAPHSDLDHVDPAVVFHAVAALDAAVAAHGTHADRTELPFWPLLFNNVTLRLPGSDDFPSAARRQAARDLTAVATGGRSRVLVTVHR